MVVLLITNSIELINKYQNQVTIINSILLAPELWENFNYIIIDESNIEVEDNLMSLIAPIKRKVAILGYTQIQDFILIKKDEFCIENIEQYFESVQPELSVINEESYDLEIRILKYIEIILDDEINLKEKLKDLTKYEYSFREKLYSFLKLNGKIKVLRNSNMKIKKELIKYLITAKLENIKSYLQSKD